MKKIILAFAIAALTFGTLVAPLMAADGPMSAAEKRRLFRKGAQLWPVYCNTCHNARPGSEKASYEWDAIMMHMRTLGNLPPDDANAILVYLKASH
jgi:mono/diheme cytochrome c family protein